MGIHYSYIKRAEKMGVILTQENNRVKAFWPERAVTIYGSDGRDAIFQMEVIQENAREEDRSEPIVAKEYGDASEDFQEDEDPAIKGVPTHGGRAYHKHHVAADCPFDEGDERFDQWNSEFDEAADSDAEAHRDDGDEEKKPASVVKPKYRAIYSELGHPTTCGDALANVLDNLVKNAGGTNIEYFLMIADANGINYSKYNRVTNGWQGRIRMTVRNMLAKKVHANGGVLNLPNGETVQMPADWMASQRFQK